MAWFGRLDAAKNYLKASEEKRLEQRIAFDLRRLNRKGLRNGIRFTPEESLEKGTKGYRWEKGRMNWRVFVTETGFTGILNYDDPQFYMGSKTILKNEVDYLHPKDSITVSHIRIPQPLQQYLKGYFESSFDVDKLERKRLSQLAEQSAIKTAPLRSANLVTMHSGGMRIYTTNGISISPSKLTITANGLPPVQTEHPIEDLNRQLKKQEERLLDMLQSEKDILSFEQEHLLENLIRDRQALMAQFHSELLLNRNDIFLLVEKGLNQLTDKMEALEQTVAVRQKQRVERMLLLIENR